MMYWVKDADNNPINLCALSFIGPVSGELRGRFTGSSDYCVLLRGNSPELGERRDHYYRILKEMQTNVYQPD